MKYSKDPISSPLTRLSPQLKSSAINLYNDMMCYMLDKPSKLKPIDHVKSHLKVSMTASEDLKDETYVQIIKQIRDHPNQNNAFRGWNFLAIISSCYPPSSDLYYSIVSWLKDEVDNNLDDKIIQRANYIIYRLVNSFENRRKHIPSDDEILHIEHMKPIMFPIFFFSNTHISVPIESYTTMKDIRYEVIKRLNLNMTRIPYYALYEVCTKADCVEERFLDDFDRITDVIAVWDKEKSFYTSQDQTIEFRIYLKIRFYYDYDEKDLDTVTLLYLQSNYDVILGKFKLEEKDIITLGAIQLLVNFGNNKEKALKHLDEKVETYIAADHYKNNPKQTWIKELVSLYEGIDETTRLESKLTYLEHLKKNNPLYEAHQFDVKVKFYSL